jgi:hypothetical protein
MLQLPNLAFFDHLYTLSNSKAKLLSSAVASQFLHKSQRQLIVPSLLLIRGRDKIKIKMEIKT